MKRVIFGEFEFGEMHRGKDVYKIVIVHSIYEQCSFADDSPYIGGYATDQGHDSYLIPSEFEGEIVYSKTFMARLGA